MFDTVKKQISLLDVLEKDLQVEFKRMGDKNWCIDGGKDVEACPFCGHHDCFRVHHVEEENESSFFKCFSCNEHGDVIAWRSKTKKLEPAEAARELAKEFGVELPEIGQQSPVQRVMTLAAGYYHSILMDEVQTKSNLLGAKTPLQYQLEVRKRKLETLKKFKIGYSDGKLYEYLDSLGIHEDVLKESGLINTKTGKDFLPGGCYIYPHFAMGRVSHFTFKDPLKRKQYQIPKKFSLNGYTFYGQDSTRNSNSVALVEGENDLLAVVEAGGTSTMATIGQLSGEQLDWLTENCRGKLIITIFDPDEAGDLYREKVELLRKYFKDLRHILPPEGKDIDELLISGWDFNRILKEHQIIVTPTDKARRGKKEMPWDEISDVPFEPTKKSEIVEEDDLPVRKVEVTPTQQSDAVEVVNAVLEPLGEVYTPPAILNTPTSVSAETSSGDEMGPDEVYEIENNDISIRRRCFYKEIVKDGVPKRIRISNFYIQLKNIYIDEETGDRLREIVVHRHDGYKSKPIEVDSETKTSPMKFKILMAKVADAEWSGKENELDSMWKLVYEKYPEVLIENVKRIGRLEKHKCWIFRNILITDSGSQILPDEDGVFWTSGKRRGIRLKSIAADENEYDSLPGLVLEKTREETTQILKETIHGLSKNFMDLGPALMCIGWVKSNIYSDDIYRRDGGYGMLMTWGTAGHGKSTIIRWLQLFFGITDKMASTSIQQLGTGVGFMRMASFFSSLPLFLDEVRADDATDKHLGKIRSWYDREGRVMGDKDPTNVKVVPIRATLMMAGEDLPADTATRQRCIMLRMPKVDTKSPEMIANYAKLTQLSEHFSNITYYWIRDYVNISKTQVLNGIKELDRHLVTEGCVNRVSKVWASAGYFANEICKELFPEFDFMAWIIKTAKGENLQQKEDGPVFSFFSNMATLQAREFPKITDQHYVREGKYVHIWYPAVYKEITDENKFRKDLWSKNAILRAIKEEPYFVSDDKKISLGISGHRRVVLTLDLSKAPEPLQSMVQYTPESDKTADIDPAVISEALKNIA